LIAYVSPSVCCPSVCPVVISKDAGGTTQPAVVIADRPVTPCLIDIDSPSTSAQQTICLAKHGCRPAFYPSDNIIVGNV